MRKTYQEQLIDMVSKHKGRYMYMSDGSIVGWFFTSLRDARISIYHVNDYGIIKAYITRDVFKLYSIVSRYYDKSLESTYRLLSDMRDQYSYIMKALDAIIEYDYAR